jgi:hypothetical protein
MLLVPKYAGMDDTCWDPLIGVYVVDDPVEDLAAEGTDSPDPADDMRFRFDAVTWFQEEFARGRFAEYSARFVALHGREVLAAGTDLDTVTEAALVHPNVSPDRVVVTFAAVPND